MSSNEQRWKVCKSSTLCDSCSLRSPSNNARVSRATHCPLGKEPRVWRWTRRSSGPAPVFFACAWAVGSAVVPPADGPSTATPLSRPLRAYALAVVTEVVGARVMETERRILPAAAPMLDMVALTTLLRTGRMSSTISLDMFS
eukprot:6183394-Pleurochrysis_carterae.AAC.7